MQEDYGSAGKRVGSVQGIEMQWNVEKTEWKGTPIFQDEKKLCYYSKGEIVTVTHDDNKLVVKMQLPIPWWKVMVTKIRILERLIHIDVRWGAKNGSGQLIMPIDNRIYCIDFEKNKITQEYSVEKGKPLQALHIKECRGFRNGIIMGDYHTNPHRGPVNIYFRDDVTAKWEIKYTFPARTIRHIHGFVQDNGNDCIYIMSGDEDSESGIWRARNDFTEIEPIVIGSQLYRCCQMLPCIDKSFYFTDAPSEDNYLCELKGRDVKRISKMPGSVITGVRVNDHLLVSTTVEPEAYAANRIEYWLTNKRGSGIESGEFVLFSLSAKGKLDKICTYKHNGLPLRLFRYGMMFFSNSMNDRVYFSPCSAKKYDNTIFRLKLCEEEGE